MLLVKQYRSGNTFSKPPPLWIGEVIVHMKEDTLHSKIILLLGLAGFMVVADNWVVSPILPVIMADLHSDLPKAGLLITAYMIPFGVCQILFGPLADRYGKKEVITLAMIMFTLATGLCAAGRSLASLSLFRAVTGVFAASVIPVSFALIADIFPIQQRQKAIGTFLGIAFLGQGMSMIIGGTIAHLSNWQGVFIAYALLSLIPTALLIRYYRQLPSTKNTGGNILAPYLDLLTNPESLYTDGIIMLEGLFIIGSFSYGGAYLAAVHQFNALSIGLVMTGFGAMSVVGGRISGKLVRRYGARKVVVLGLAITAAADLLIWMLGNHILIFSMASALMGFGFITAHSTLVTRASEFAKKATGTAMSLVALSFMGCGGIGTALGGMIIRSHGLPALYLCFGLALSATVFVSAFILGKYPCPSSDACSPVDK